MEDREMFDSTIMILPTVLAILSLAMFNEKTRWFCYTLAVLAIGSEFVSHTINPVAVAATCAVLVALLAIDFVHHAQANKLMTVKHSKKWY